MCGESGAVFFIFIAGAESWRCTPLVTGREAADDLQE